jgi:FkbM family methyltransferase
MISFARSILKEKVPRLYDVARFLRLKGERAFSREYVARHHFGGHELSIAISDRIAREWYDHDMERPSSFDFLAGRGLLENARVFMLGAHQAVIGLMLEKDIGAKGSIVAVEGNHSNYLAGKRNLQLNRSTNITWLHAVVGCTDGTVPFSQSHNGMVAIGDHTLSSEQTTSVTIDTLADRYGPPDIVMLDIEGYEAHALEGAAGTLNSGCAWYVEIHGDVQLGRYGKSNADVICVFERNFDLFLSSDDVTPFVAKNLFGKLPHNRFFAIAIPNLSGAR